ncbi:hypothetical protein K435DRAFT_804391 [Dendrothele bispora CBS 962.96]|uniref:Uncharacterized protein n=1 Tax=Dendrothele bispora (strain CBS 962.96) TaxID=1314807 RepID=A0A4S8LF42_DENBC|nr:hypothetical protein K435DRAFT_804391 [Dendrothele bispora CBS 962.96]
MAEEENIGTFSTTSTSSFPDVTSSSTLSDEGSVTGIKTAVATDLPPKAPKPTPDEQGPTQTQTKGNPGDPPKGAEGPITVTGPTSVDAPGFTSIAPSPGLTSVDTPDVTSIAPSPDLTRIDAPGLTSIDAPGLTSIDTPGLTSIDAPGLTSIDAPGLTSIDALDLTRINAPSPSLTSIDGNAPITITSSRVVALTASSTPTSSASVDDDSSFFSDKPTVIGVFVAAGLVLALLIGFCVFKISQRNKRRMEKEQDMENDEIIAEFAANTLAQREKEKQEKEENDGRGRDPDDFTRQNEDNNYTLPGQGYGYGGGDYPGGPTDSAGYPVSNQYAFNSNTPSHRYPTAYPSPISNMNPMRSTPPLSGPNGSVPRSKSNPFIQQQPLSCDPSSPHRDRTPTAAVAAAVGNEERLPNPYDGIEDQGSSAPHFLGSDERMNSRVSLASVESYGSMNQPPIQSEGLYGRNNAYLAVHSWHDGWDGRNRGS